MADKKFSSEKEAVEKAFQQSHANSVQPCQNFINDCARNKVSPAEATRLWANRFA